MALKDIIGQDKAVHILLSTLQRGRLPSSYLFAGESGIGKKFTAVNLSKAVNCLTPPAKGENRGVIDACDNCPSCRKIEAGIHPDFLLIEPEGGQIRIEEIRQINGILSLKPFEGEKKVIILDEAHSMNSFAANAFLKTLEEPPKDSLIILVSSNPDRLPDTIRSRCSQVNFTPLSYETCKKVIQALTGIKGDKGAEERLNTIVGLSMGRPGLAVTEDLIEERAWFLKLLKEMLNREKDGWSSKEEMEKWFDLLMILLRDMATIKITDDELILINKDLKNYLYNISKEADLPVIIENYQIVNALRGYLNFHLNKSLTWNYAGSLLRKIMDVKYA